MVSTNLVLGLLLTLLCLSLQTGVSSWSVRYYIERTERAAAKGRRHPGFGPLTATTTAMLFACFVRISLWALLFVIPGQFAPFYDAAYHSAVNFATLGHGDIVMQAEWKLLGPLEAINGSMMLGMIAAALMAMLQHMTKAALVARLPRRQSNGTRGAIRVRPLRTSTGRSPP